MEASFQLKLEREKGILKMMPLDIKEGTLFGFHWNCCLGEHPFLAYNQLESPFNLSCSLCDKEKVCEGIVSKNIKAWWIGEIFGVTFEFGLWGLSCLFKLSLCDEDYSVGIFFPNDGVGGHCHRCPTYKLPIVGNMSFSSAKSKNGWWLNWPTLYCVWGGLSKSMGLA